MQETQRSPAPSGCGCPTLDVCDLFDPNVADPPAAADTAAFLPLTHVGE